MNQELLKKNWDFVLYEKDGERFLEVVFFDKPIDYTRTFSLQDVNIILDVSYLSQLSEMIRNNYESYKDSEVTLD
ncbi:MAG: hypothetical protein ACK40G_14480 [Cytophagaceae bacterium]